MRFVIEVALRFHLIHVTSMWPGVWLCDFELSMQVRQGGRQACQAKQLACSAHVLATLPAHLRACGHGQVAAPNQKALALSFFPQCSKRVVFCFSTSIIPLLASRGNISGGKI